MAQFDTYLRAQLRPRQLQMLIAVDDMRHLGRVAASMNVTQPAVSKALAKLESGLGLQLFERTTHDIRPTIYGASLIRSARVMIQNLAQARDDLRGLISGNSGTIRVGLLTTTGLALLPSSLVLLKTLHPEVTVIVREGFAATLVPELLLGNLDLIVGRLTDHGGTNALSQKTLMDENVTLVVGRHHPLAMRKRLRWSDLARYPWIMPPTNAQMREPLERAFHRHGLPIPANRVDTLSIPVICACLSQTDAIASLAEHTSRYYESLGLLARLPLTLPGPGRPIGVAWGRQYPLAPCTQALINCLEEVAHGIRPTSASPAQRRTSVSRERRRRM